MRKLITLAIALVSAGMYGQNIDVSTGYKSNGLTTSQLNALPGSVKTTGLLIRDSTKDSLMIWDGTAYRALLDLGGGASLPIDATDVNIADSGTLITATTVEGALQENRTAINLNTAKVGLTDGDKGDIVVSGTGTTLSIDTGVIVNANVNSSAAIAGTKLANTPAGRIAATTVQAAINELDTEKGGLASNNTWTGLNKIDNTSGTNSPLYFENADSNITNQSTVSGSSIFFNSLGQLYVALQNKSTSPTVTYADWQIATNNTETRTYTLPDKSGTIAMIDDVESAALPSGGTTGQVLAKASSDDGDVEWADQTGGGTDDQTAAEVPITDSGAYFTGTDVEAALQELGAAMAGGTGITSQYMDSDKTLEQSDFGKYIYTDHSIELTIDNTPVVNSKLGLKPIDIDSTITVIPDGVTFTGDGQDISQGFIVDSLNLATVFKLASNLYSVDGVYKPYVPPVNLYGTANAASPINEANSTTGFVVSKPASMTLSTVTTPTTNGTYAIKNVYSSGGSDGMIRITRPSGLVAGKKYKISVDISHNDAGIGNSIALSTSDQWDSAVSTNIPVTTGYNRYSVTATLTDITTTDSGRVRIYFSNFYDVAIDVFIDNITWEEVE